MEEMWENTFEQPIPTQLGETQRNNIILTSLVDDVEEHSENLKNAWETDEEFRSPVWDGVAWLGFVWPGLEWCHPVGVGVARFGMVWPGWGSCGPVWSRCRILQLDPTLEFFRLAGELYNPVAPREDFDEEWSDVGEDEDFIE
ncbi:hypothetical protein QE152_g6770 [Popillia japonica]|uniref:Uncharacterized protein n=1 Tax=Popillia japonica TaxID=7064 RepID=A0AAW1MHX5_POPJA